MMDSSTCTICFQRIRVPCWGQKWPGNLGEIWRNDQDKYGILWNIHAEDWRKGIRLNGSNPQFMTQGKEKIGPWQDQSGQPTSDLGNRPLHPCWVRRHPASCSAQTWMTSAKTSFWVDRGMQDIGDGYASRSTKFFDPVRMKNSQIHWTSTKIYVQWIWQFPVPYVDLGISTASLAQCHLQGPARRQWPRYWQKTQKTSRLWNTKTIIKRVSTCFNEVI